MDRIPAVGFDPIPGLLGDQRGSNAPADRAFLGQRALEPRPAWAGFRDKEAMRTFGLQLTHELIAITLAGTKVAQGANRSVVCCGDRGNGARRFVDIQTDGEGARRGPG